MHYDTEIASSSESYREKGYYFFILKDNSDPETLTHLQDARLWIKEMLKESKDSNAHL